MTQPAPLQRFRFDTVFDGDRVVEPVRPKKAFTLEEVDAEKRAAFAAGERSAVAAAEAAQAAALAEAADAARLALGALAEAAHAHRTTAAALALATARRIADAALDRFPEAPLTAAFAALEREVEAQPRLALRLGGPVEGHARVREALEGALAAVGHPAALSFATNPKAPRAAFVLEWGDGRAAYDPEVAAQRVAEALDGALAAEGLHAEALPSLNGAAR